MPDYSDPFLLAMLTNLSADESTSDAVPLNNCRQHWHSLTIKKDTTAGRVVVEIAPTRDFTGTWDVIFEMNVADADLASALLLADVERQISWPGPGGFVRHRIDTALTGGANHTVTSTMRRINMGY